VRTTGWQDEVVILGDQALLALAFGNRSDEAARQSRGPLADRWAAWRVFAVWRRCGGVELRDAALLAKLLAVGRCDQGISL
jgi:hypothetical protein